MCVNAASKDHAVRSVNSSNAGSRHSSSSGRNKRVPIMRLSHAFRMADSAAASVNHPDGSPPLRGPVMATLHRRATPSNAHSILKHRPFSTGRFSSLHLFLCIHARLNVHGHGHDIRTREFIAKRGRFVFIIFPNQLWVSILKLSTWTKRKLSVHGALTEEQNSSNGPPIATEQYSHCFFERVTNTVAVTFINRLTNWIPMLSADDGQETLSY